jgi:hypothetical protein
MKFNLVFSSLLAIALISGGTAVRISAQPKLNTQQEQIVSTCLDTWKITAAAITGLIGGRNLHDHEDEDKTE